MTTEVTLQVLSVWKTLSLLVLVTRHDNAGLVGYYLHTVPMPTLPGIPRSSNCSSMAARISVLSTGLVRVGHICEPVHGVVYVEVTAGLEAAAAARREGK